MSSQEAFVPPVGGGLTTQQQSRNVVFLFDGTGDKVDADVTNVVQLCKILYNNALEKEGNDLKPDPSSENMDDSRQIVFYRRGIGTWRPAPKSALYGYISQAVDKAIATNFEDHVIDAYTALANNYKDGDKICLFGFSRGAYTARAVAAVVGFFGILPPEFRDPKIFHQIKEIYFKHSRGFSSNPNLMKQFYADIDQFRKTHKTISVTIEFLGVWDTVKSVGLFRSTGAMYTSSNPHVKTFRHAIALDERRARFDRSMWRYNPKFKTDIEQVWFAGVHCDVGGGSVSNGTKPNLANIPFRWMIRECFKTNTGIVFNSKGLREYGIDPASLYPMVQTRPEALSLLDDTMVQTPDSVKNVKVWAKEANTEEEHDYYDSCAPLYDMLTINWALWNPLEVIPIKKWKEAEGKEVTEANWWAGRKIDVVRPDGAQAKGFDGKIKVHRTVKMRMLAKSVDNKESYVPAATIEVGGRKFQVDSDEIEWVD
ncbi:hypothetical protein K435DRAFT_367663 [Dendrothele bispora CBS 962.96]|uniref:T6SS Phospholipase effector Tle1-like catalytic domain-containing protein n=1 Tax=Dendrothele bispora (strain CBS 962.96) TaxID=1314807 RepID=A0A4S8MH64_DENBC|nr:hypothetical protein K435DRAFT_367663 [Dendrothele bispora CBS 962.96]